MTGLPTIFLSHSGPTVVIEPSPLNAFLKSLGGIVGRPEAILVATAHWETEYPALTTAEHPGMIYDFRGFPAELYQMTYPAPGAPALAERAAGLLAESGLKVGLSPTRGLDHGTWTPLILAWPDADIPVVQLSVQPHLDPAHHFRVGQALAPLRDAGVLIIGSGSFTHNLTAYFAQAFKGFLDTKAEDAFAEWVAAALASRDIDALLNYRTRAPMAREMHPTDEHFLPFFIALGAAGADAPAQKIHSSYFGSISNDCYRFG